MVVVVEIVSSGSVGISIKLGEVVEVLVAVVVVVVVLL